MFISRLSCHYNYLFSYFSFKRHYNFDKYFDKDKAFVSTSTLTVIIIIIIIIIIISFYSNIQHSNAPILYNAITHGYTFMYPTAIATFFHFFHLLLDNSFSE